LFIAVFIALPVIVLTPSKFAIAFTLGNGCVLAGAASLYGPRATLGHAFAKDRAPVAACYCASAVGTLYAAPEGEGAHRQLMDAERQDTRSSSRGCAPRWGAENLHPHPVGQGLIK
jgi:hypothetical protein